MPALLTGGGGLPPHPVWQSGWAYAAYGLFFGVLVWRGIRWRLAKFGSDKARLEREISRALAAEAEKQAALKASEERYALAAAGANEAIWDLLPGSDEVFVSDRLWGMLGLDPRPRQMSLAEWEALTHPEDLPRVREALRNHLRDRLPFDVELRLQAVDGEWRWFRSRGQAQWAPDGRATRMGGSIGDITERKRAEQELLIAKQAAEARNRELEELDDTVKAINREMDLETLMHELLVQISARFPQVQRGMFLLRDERDVAFTTKAALSRCPEVVEASMRFSLPVEDVEAWLDSRPEGAAEGVHLVEDIEHLPGYAQMSFPPRSLLIMPIVIRGTVEGLFALHNDEDPKAFEAADLAKLLRFREHIISAVSKAKSIWRLDQTVRALAETMQIADSARIIAEFEREDAREARAQAEQASQAKTAFLANMSHEIRTPMNAILGFAELMRRDPALSAAHRENLAVIHRSGEALLDLINGILDLSKIEAGLLPLNEGPFGLAVLFREVEQLFALKAREKGINFSCGCAPDCPPWLFGDEGKLRQVLVNLLGNALKFTPRGSVSLTAQFDGQRLQVAVADTGVGISPEDQANLFRPFQQTASGRASRQGTGLGLALSRQLVHLMGGDLAVSSAEGVGSTFSFSLPLRIADEGAVSAAAPLGVVTRLAPGQPDWLILVADDIPESRAVLGRFLEAWGFRVVEAAHGLEAVERWQAHHPDLTFMDMRMPVLNGREATQRIKALSGGQALVVAQSASAFEEELDTFLQAGCDRSLRKPLRIPEVVQVLEELLGAVFLREGEPAAAGKAPVLGPIPEPFRASLRQACVEGDLDRVREVAGTLRSGHPALAERLEHFADTFDLPGLSTLLG